jgi:hypothetical protein
MLSLDTLSKNYGLDKNISSGWHNYIPMYTHLFEPKRLEKMNVFEIGVGVTEHGQMVHVQQHGYVTGNSLRCWRDYFPNSELYGMDIYETDMKNEPRIHTYIGDQSKGEDLATILNEIGGSLDIVIDDGSHKGEHQVFTFMFLYKFMSIGSIYVIEDVQFPYQTGFRDMSIFPESFQEYIRNHFEYTCHETGHESPLHDDFLVILRRKK